MSSIEKVLVQQSLLGIFSCPRTTDIDLKGWVANQNYFVDDPLVNNDFIVRASDAKYLKSALANDCNRMASASIESISGVQLDDSLRKSGAWGVIRTYYSAFFAAHSIMRMFGISCSQLDQAHVNKIFESAKTLGKTGGLVQLERGFYSISIDPRFSLVRFKKNKDSHRDTWGEFLKLLENLSVDSRNVAAISKYKIEAIDIISTIKRGITRSGCGDKGNWLSLMRNSVNYQQSHGVWFPYDGRQTAQGYIDSAGRDWTKPIEMLDRGLNRGDIETFFEVSLLISALFRELLVGCAEKSGGGNKVFSNGALKLLKTLRAA